MTEHEHDPIYDLYAATLSHDESTALIVGHLRLAADAQPATGHHVPLFDELTPYIADDSPYPLYALVSFGQDDAPRPWRLLPVESRAGTPSAVRLQPTDHTHLIGLAIGLGEHIYPALDLSGVINPPGSIHVYPPAYPYLAPRKDT